MESITSSVWITTLPGKTNGIPNGNTICRVKAIPVQHRCTAAFDGLDSMVSLPDYARQNLDAYVILKIVLLIWVLMPLLRSLKAKSK
jgi:hypothetical protein